MFINGIEYVPITDVAAKGILQNTYYISKEGKIYSLLSNKIMKGTINSDNYTVYNLKMANNTYKVFYLHRLLMMTFNYQNNCESLQVNHMDGNKQHNYLSNYEWVTLQENTYHARKNNLCCIGEDCSWAKLNEKQVREICEILQDTDYYTLNDIARMYNCNRGIIRDIAVGNTWKHISKDYEIIYLPRTRSKNKNK